MKGGNICNRPQEGHTGTSQRFRLLGVLQSWGQFEEELASPLDVTVFMTLVDGCFTHLPRGELSC